MKQLKITVYKGNTSEPETTIKIPLTALRIVNALIPKKVREKMANEGINIQEIVKAMETGDAKGKLVEIEGKDEHIVISAE